VIFATTLVGLVLVRLYAYTYEGNITGFFHIGANRPISPYLLNQALVRRPSDGYDGQFFLNLALDPLLRHPDTVQALDHPQYRYRRIFYPLLGHVLGLGQPVLIPFVLVGLNAVAAILLTGLVGRELRAQDLSPWRSLLIFLVPGLWITIILSTADLLSTLFAVYAFMGYRQQRNCQVGLAIALACLTRETMLVEWLALTLSSIGDRRQRQFWVLLIALIPVLGWHLYGLYRLPKSTLEVSGIFTLPLMGLWEKVTTVLDRGWLIGNVFDGLAFLGLLLSLVATLGLVSDRDPANRPILICTWFYALLVSCSRLAILEHSEAYSRVFMMVYLLTFLSRSPHSVLQNCLVLIPTSLVCAKMALDLLV